MLFCLPILLVSLVIFLFSNLPFCFSLNPVLFVFFPMNCAFKKSVVVLDAADLFSCMWPDA